MHERDRDLTVCFGAVCVQRLAQSDAKIEYLYCGQPYAFGYGINSALLYDGIHPNAQGLDLLAACIQRDVDETMRYDAS